MPRWAVSDHCVCNKLKEVGSRWAEEQQVGRVDDKHVLTRDRQIQTSKI